MATGRDFDTELLVLQCQEGDTEALGALVMRWQDRVWRHALRLTGKEDVAWDVVQETFLAVGKGVVRLHNPAAFPAWVYQLASHKARDWLRRERRKRRLHEAYGWQQSREPVEAEGETDTIVDLRTALAALPGEDRAILGLRYEEEFSVSEIAAILGIPEGTVKSRLHHARGRLKRTWERVRDE